MSRDQAPRQRRVFAALDQALAADAPTRARQDAFAVEALTSRPALAALADRLEAAHADLLLGGQNDAHRSSVGLRALEDIRRAADLARAAAVHGYPRPALEALGSEADRLPTARTADPVTSHDARPPQATRRNHLGKLLVGFFAYELSERYAWGDDVTDDDDVDVTLTSEELAARVGLLHAEYAKRCSDLKALGYIRVAKDANGHDRTRRGAAGPQRLVFELTADGRRKAEELAKSAG